MREAAQSQAEKEKEMAMIQKTQQTILEAQKLFQDESLDHGLQILDDLFKEIPGTAANINVSYIENIPLGPTGELGRVPWIRPSAICRALEVSLEAPNNYWEKMLQDYPDHPARNSSTKKIGWSIHGDEGAGAGKACLHFWHLDH